MFPFIFDDLNSSIFRRADDWDELFYPQWHRHYNYYYNPQQQQQMRLKSDTTSATEGGASSSNEVAIQQQQQDVQKHSGHYPFQRQPRFEVSDTEEALVVRAETPGVAKENLNVQVEGGRLTVSGRSEQQSKGFHSIGSFSRTWTLPTHVNSDEMTAEYVDGVLTLRLPKQAKAPAPRQITIS